MLRSWMEHAGAPSEQVEASSRYAGLALEWKWLYGDGDLVSWDPASLLEYLVGWCPSKLSAGPEAVGEIVGGLHALLGMLDSEGLLAHDGESLETLNDVIEVLEPEAFEAMGDPSNFSLAKSLVYAMQAEGVDCEDEAAVTSWMTEFNSRPFEERDAVLGPALGGMAGAGSSPSFPVLPFVVLPGDDEVAASKAKAPVLALFAALVDYCDAGLRLTAKGHLSRKDGDALAVLLETGERMEYTFAGRTTKIRSSAELPQLSHLMRWARKAGVVWVRHGVLRPTAFGRKLLSDPSAAFDRVLGALVDMGPIMSYSAETGWYWDGVSEFLDASLPHLMLLAYLGWSAGESAALSDMAATASEAVTRAFQFGSDMALDMARMVVDSDIERLVGALDRAGVLEWSDFTEEHRFESVLRRGGVVTLTPAGVVEVRRWLLEAGYGAPTAGALCDLEATELLDALVDRSFDEGRAELAAWCAKRSVEEAVSGLSEAIMASESPANWQVGLVGLEIAGSDLAEAAVRALDADPRRRGVARCWLVDNGLEPYESLYDQEDPASFLDVLALRLIAEGVDEMCAVFELVGDKGEQLEWLSVSWRAPSMFAAEVFDALGRAHPDRRVAKEARKAAMRHRSWRASC